MRFAGIWSLVAALGLAASLITTGGCLGGNRNFVTGADAATRGPTSQDPARRDVGPRPGNIAPDFSVKALDGSTVRLSDLRGKPLLVNFWATWCPPCRDEMPDLEKAYQKYKGEGLVFLGIDMKEDVATVQAFVQSNGFHWTFAIDATGQAANSYYVTGIPESFFIDRDGIVQDFQIGALSGALLEAKLSKIR